jgi:beta-aspartyl-dipeptidase (metallo-type)
MQALLIRHARVWAPEPLGLRDILIVGEQVAAIGTNLELPPWADPACEWDAEGHDVIPGLVDLHVHIAGGGGEGGPVNRTPEIQLSQLTTAGITTVVGVLGTDATTRSVQELLAKARALEGEGLTAWIYTGAYQVPTRTITDSPRNDLILIDRVVGIGEIAVSDQRGSHSSPRELARLAAEARVGGMLGGKAGILHCHVGDGAGGLSPLEDMLHVGDIPLDTLLPTHLNRNARLVDQAAAWARRGGYVDFTTDIRPAPEDPAAVPAHEAALRLRAANVPWDRITFSSDAQGSAPIFDLAGRLTRVGVGSPRTLWEEVRALVDQGLPLDVALRPVTTSPAERLKLPHRGRIAVGAGGDLVMLDDHLAISMVTARGRILVENGRAVVQGRFETVR